MQLLEIILVLISITLHLSKCQTITISLETTDNGYLVASKGKIGWGTPKQSSFKLLVDTTDHTSWVYNKTTNTDEETFNPGESSTFSLSNEEEVYFEYQNEQTTIKFAHDTLTIDDAKLPNQRFAIAVTNFSIAEEEGFSGFLSLDRANTIISGLKNNQSIETETALIDVNNEKLYLGPHTPSPINNESNITDTSNTTNGYLQKMWTYDITMTFNGNYFNTGKAVIDTASPYISIYTKDETKFKAIWRVIDGTSTGDFNCNFTSRLCSDTDTVMDSLTIINSADDWDVTILKDDILDGDYVKFFYDGDRDFTNDTDYVLFLGQPYLQYVGVEMNYPNDTLKFYSIGTSTTTLNWPTILIVFACVIAFAGLFFGVYYWKYGRIPPPSNNDVEEQSLLRGPSVQAVGTGNQPVGQGSGAQYSGISGLDEDDDAQFQSELQQAQRQSQIEAQQARERQLRQDRERREQEEQKQQEIQQQQARHSRQESGGRLGGNADKPQDKDDLRARRLKFLEQQAKKDQENDDQ